MCQRLRDLLKRQAGDRGVVAVAVGWQLPGDRHRLRIPDVMLLQDSPSGDLVTEAPSVVIEVLSGNRTDDLVRKSVEYWQAGVGQYWVVDPGLRVVDVYAHNPTGWDRIVQLTDESPEATVVVPPIGTITLSLPDVLR